MKSIMHFIQESCFCGMMVLAIALCTPSTLHNVDPPPSQSALTTSINGPTDLALTDAGLLYILESRGQRIVVLDTDRGTIQPLRSLLNKADIPIVDSPRAIAAASDSDIYVATPEIPIIRFRQTPRTLEIGFAGADESIHTRALATMSSGDLLIADTIGNRILRWHPTNKKLDLVAGKGMIGFAGDGGPAETALLRFPAGVASLSNGDILIADSGNCRLRMVDHRSLNIRTIAGTGECKSSGDGGEATKAGLNDPGHVAVDKADNIYVVEGGSNRIRRITSDGTIRTFAGNGKVESSGDNGPAVKAGLASPTGIAIDSQGNVYIAEFVGNRIRRVDSSTGIITTVAGNGLPRREDPIL